jgi:hypothetical protein
MRDPLLERLSIVGTPRHGILDKSCAPIAAPLTVKFKIVKHQGERIICCALSDVLGFRQMIAAASTAIITITSDGFGRCLERREDCHAHGSCFRVCRQRELKDRTGTIM